MRPQNLSYFGLFGKLLLLGGILFANMSLLMWLFGQFQLTGWLLPAGLIGNVHAESASPAPDKAAPPRIAPARHPAPKAYAPQPASLAAASGEQLVLLHFDKSAITLTQEQQASLAQALQAQNVAPGRRVRILSGPVPLENNILTSQTEKLRAQAVAREVFPYTRAVEIKLGQPTLQSGAIAVEFPPPAPQGS